VRWAALPGLIAIAGLAACASRGAGEPIPSGRLPSDTRPLAYRLELEIDPAQPRFAGRVEIDVELARARTTVWLHALELAVREASVELEDGSRVSARFEMADPTGVAALRLAREVGPGRATLVLRWDAAFAPGLRGLYRVQRGDDAYAFTQMEPIDARRAFPGFDEPAFKVPFDVSLVVPEGLVALANTPEMAAQPRGDGRVRRSYARTPPLPTYLLAWAVGPLDVVDAPAIEPNAVRSFPLPLRGVAPRGRGPELAFALASTPAILAAVERYVGSPYPFAKLDLVAVPDFSAGAMENVGLVTFRDGLLLIDPETAPVGQRRASAGVMAHELVHMWFGNLVTMPWWDDIWLNEAFATWLSSKTIGELYPEHRSDLHRVLSIQHAMQADSLATARRIREPIRSTHDIRNAFDPITYQKGGAVLAMFEAAAGEEAFRDAVRAYLARHASATATGDDFLAAVASELGEPFAAAMRSFLDQAGLPMLQVEPLCVSADAVGGERIEWHVGQRRYVPLGSSLDPVGQWGVPLCPGGAQCQILTEPRGVVSVAGGGCPPWIHPNPGAAGYFRWSLPAEVMAQLLGARWGELSVLERLSVADALRAGYRAGTMSAADVLGSLAGLVDDPERPIATAPLGLLREARDRLATTDAERAAVEATVRALYGARARELGFDDEPGDDGERKLLRGAVVGAVVVYGRDGALRAEALERGRRHLLTPPGEPAATAASAELLDLVARIAVEDGGRAEFEAAWSHLFATEDSIVRGRMLGALAYARDPQSIERARSLVFEPDIRSNERLIVLSTQANHAERPEQREDVFAWVRERADEIVEAITLPRAAGLLQTVSGFCSRAAADRIEAWLGDRIDRYPGGPRRLARVVERIELCAARSEQQRASALDFFARADAL
jgi:alanyl aminopeptidase